MNYKDLRSIQETYNALHAELEEGYGTGAAMIRGGGKPKKKVDVFAYDRKIGKKTTPDGKPLPPAPKNEEVDAFDIIKGHLIGEGLTEEEALAKMVNMTAEEKAEILAEV